MYRLGRRLVHHYLRYAVAGLLLVAIVVGTVLAARQWLQPHTMLKQSSAITHTVTADELAPEQIREPLFVLQLPSGWHATEPPHINYHIYSWTGSGLYGSARRLDIYVDGVPPNMAFNRLLPVEAAGAAIDVTGTVSDNCTNFTDKTPDSRVSGEAPSKWGGVNFYCDTANYERDVVAIGAPEAINQISLRGSMAGAHQILLVYTDNNITPDYTIFIAIIKSFHLL